jgi:hypothetical protein
MAQRRRGYILITKGPPQRALCYSVDGAESVINSITEQISLRERAGLVFVHFDRFASFIENANQGIMGAAVKLGVDDCIADSIRLAIPWPTASLRNTRHFLGLEELSFGPRATCRAFARSRTVDDG